MTSDEDLLFQVLRNCLDNGDCCDINMITIADATYAEYCDEYLIDENGRVSLAYENLRHIPRHIAERFGTQTKSLDLSFNNFSDFSFLTCFCALHTLILDRNEMPQESTFPFLPNLEILWMNNCSLQNITKWIYKIQRQCPKIRYLSLLGNPGARTLFVGATVEEENEYRSFVINALPTLIYLDDRPISPPPKYITKSHKPQNPRRGKKRKAHLVRNLLRLRELCHSSSTT